MKSRGPGSIPTSLKKKLTKIGAFFAVQPDTGPYYTQLGFADSFEEVRSMMEKRTGLSGKALRLVEAIYCTQEGKSKTGCPLAKQVS
jgi:hypothetical protein